MIDKLKNRVFSFLFKTEVIPTFPTFKKISLKDKVLIHSLIGTSRPYSTVNFTNLWAWDIHDSRLISNLNDNLVILFSDYETKEPFLFFYGQNKPVHTAKELLSYAQSENFFPSLRFITEETMELLQDSDFLIEEDIDNADYIFSTEKLSESKGHFFKSKRVLARNFIHKYPDAILEIRDLDSEHLKEHIYEVAKLWSHNKTIHQKSFELKNELIALSRLFDNLHEHKLLLTSVSVQGKMVGFSIDEILPHKYAMAHFIKADVSYKGIYEYLNEMTARHLLANNVEFWNWQQDLGITGLRKLKVSYRPVQMLKKFTISLK